MTDTIVTEHHVLIKVEPVDDRFFYAEIGYGAKPRVFRPILFEIVDGERKFRAWVRRINNGWRKGMSNLWSSDGLTSLDVYGSEERLADLMRRIVPEFLR